MTSEIFSIPPRRYIRQLAVDWATRNWLILTLPAASALVWSIFDVRAVYVALILLFLVYPMTLTLVWFNYAFSPNCIRAITPKQATVSSEGISIEYQPTSDDRPPLKPCFIDWRDVLSAEMTARTIDLVLGKGIDDKLRLPVDSFSENAWNTIIKHVSDKLPSVDPD